MEDGGLLASGKRNLYRFAPDSEASEIFATLVDIPDNQRLNDGKCDALGRLWVGTMMLEGFAQGKLFKVSGATNAETMLEGIACSNGVVWSSCSKYMLYIDTPLQKVWRFDFDLESGCIANRTVAIDTAPYGGWPDGMTIDAEGKLWVAIWGASCVLRFDPDTAELLGKVELPAQCVTSCAFGGADLKTLYITTAAVDAEANNPDAGCLYAVETDTLGLPAQRMK